MAWGGRAIAICVAAFIASQVTGCTKREPITPSAVPTSGNADLEIVLADGTSVRLDDAKGSGEGLCGVVHQCLGPSCGRVRVDHCVAKQDVVTLKERKMSDTAVAVGVTGAVLGVALTVAAIAAASSSPKAAPRTDFDRLDHLVVDGGSYRLRVVNEQDETEHTDLVRLRVVDHPAGTRVVPTAAGKLVTFRDEARPTIARDFRDRDALDLVTTKDDREWSSDLRDRSALRADDARDGLRLVFGKPHGARTAKLRVAAHNTEWSGQMLGYLLAHRGTTLPAWFARMNTDARARAEFEAFLLREGMLNVRVKTLAGWSTRGVFWAAGSEIVKEEAFELEVGDLPGDTLEIELESALDFWSVDAASIAYGPNEPTVVRDLSPSSARTTNGRDVTAVLARRDGARFDTVRGDVAELSFAAPSPPAAGSVRSFVLETNGSYVPEIAPAADADPAAMDTLMDSPFSASRLALAFRLATRGRSGH